MEGATRCVIERTGGEPTVTLQRRIRSIRQKQPVAMLSSTGRNAQKAAI